MESDGGFGSKERSDFAIKHYEIVAASFMRLWELRWNYVQLSLFGIFAFYAAIFSESLNISRSNVLDILVWLPVVFSILGFFHARALRVGMKRRNDILSQIEQSYGLFGWAQKYQELDRNGKISNFMILTYIYWIFIMVLATALAASINVGWITF